MRLRSLVANKFLDTPSRPAAVALSLGLGAKGQVKESVGQAPFEAVAGARVGAQATGGNGVAWAEEKRDRYPDL